ncbi:MAG: EAL domain-containing protein [Acidimicrobiales bacterium]|nr:EAL domain-containing protein [Acidimicrobiales bacterium]
MQIAAPTVDGTALDAVLAGQLQTRFQPIVDIDTAEIVAFEALTRLPATSPFLNPDQLFAAARRHGRLLDVDLACIRSALSAATELPPSMHLFVNVEPSTLDGHLGDLDAWQRGDHRLMIEITERAIGQEPAKLIRAVREARARGVRIALDDVGANLDALAYLPLLQPDVVKLDMGLIRNKEDRVLGRTMAAVLAYAERSGATILAEGIETDEHLERALTLGAELGQGWRWGRAAPLPALRRPGRPLLPAPLSTDPHAASPFQLATAAGLPVRQGRQRTLLQMSHQVEELAQTMPGAILLSAFQHAERFTPATHQRYSRLARSCTLVAAFGVDLASQPAPGVRGASITAEDALADEWTVVALGPQYAAALTALDQHQGDGPDRRFAFAVTHDRSLVEQLARHLVARIDDSA